MGELSGHDLTFVVPRGDEAPDADVTIVPHLLNGHRIWLEGSLFIVKHIRSSGGTAAYLGGEERHPETSLRAAEFVVPAVLFAAEAAASGAIEMFVDAVWRFVRRQPRAARQLEVRYKITSGTEWAELKGPADQVLEALRVLSRSAEAAGTGEDDDS